MCNEDVSALVKDQYLESVRWIKFIWGLRMTLITSVLSAGWLGVAYTKTPEIIFISMPIILFVDFGCTYVISPFVYSSLYFENYVFQNKHNIITNWNTTFNLPLDMITKDEEEISSRSFMSTYIKRTFYRKIPAYLILLFVLAVSFIFIRQ